MNQSEKVKLAVLQNNVDHIKKDLAETLPKIDAMHDTFIKGEGKISALNKEVFGNGKRGLREEVNTINKRLAYWAGGIGAFVVISQFAIQVLI